MTRDDVIKLAREAGDDVEHTLPSDLDFLERFASIVAAAERERIARAALTPSAESSSTSPSGHAATQTASDPP